MTRDLTDIPIAPGIYAEETDRGAENRWKAGWNVRFFKGLPEKIGGWVKASTNQFAGACRGMIDWLGLDGRRYIGIGTHKKLYVFTGGTFSNVTPIAAAGNLTDPFDTTDGSVTVQVTHSAHGLTVGTTVYFSGADPVGGVTIDGAYEVQGVLGTDTYTILHSSAATSTATGGGTVAYQYEVSAGPINTVAGLGWGAGPWGSGTWGTPRTVSNILRAARTWSLVPWGEDLIANYRNGPIYVWDASSGLATRAALVSGAPATTKGIILSAEDRHLIAYGAHDGSNLDPLLVRWCDQENYTQWSPSSTNTAGDKRLDYGNEIVGAVRARGEILLVTDTAAHAMYFIGPPYTFGFRNVGIGCGMAGPHAGIEHLGSAYYMGEDNFYVYNGTVQTLPCDVKSYVFGDINLFQKAKIHAGRNQKFDEVIWFYCSAAATEIDRYVAFNVMDRTWSVGGFPRTKWLDRNVAYASPIATSIDGYLYAHETGVNADTDPLVYSLESWDIDLGSGSEILHLKALIPDYKAIEGNHEVAIKVRKYPSDTPVTKGPAAISAASKRVPLRARGRQMSLVVSGDEVDTSFRMGTWRADVVQHGKR
ncbi:MAG: hypothetical protein KF895_02920 [Parvibaculum sp.]|nr:hypothetical protein [Parvibaculum sp.]